ncbi:MAG: toxin-antitoxin system [Alphaproteobacteria bacterium]|nr:toxin-antitoxin system [Alphaproteobacteria bacterium]
MAQLLVRNLDDGVKERLRRLAERHGRSLEQEVREILTGAAAQLRDATEPGIGTRITSLFAGRGLDTEFPELRGQPVRPAEFDP